MSSHSAVADERRFDEKREYEKRDTLAPESSSPDLTEAEVTSHLPRFRGRTLTALISFIAGTGFTLFGYACPSYRTADPYLPVLILLSAMTRVS